ILNHDLSSELAGDMVHFLSRCQHPTGGFGGGPWQMAHLATTYAAINAVTTIGTEEAFDMVSNKRATAETVEGLVDRESMVDFLWRMRQADGTFLMHEGGESDVRGCYSAAVIAVILNIQDPALFEGTAEYIARCQTYEGGFAGVPGAEAHGGYTFCSLSCLVLLGRADLCDIDGLLRWASHRQMCLEGGFSGRCNKLVDGCYSFWVGAIFPILDSLFRHWSVRGVDKRALPDVPYNLFHEDALTEYILGCCQGFGGGLLDKPGKPADMYHTCYTLSGLAISTASDWVPEEDEETQDLVLDQLNPLLGVSAAKAVSVLEYFQAKTKIIRTKPV
ncbi:unnamed protein product, partial [Cyprideis torosa]